MAEIVKNQGAKVMRTLISMVILGVFTWYFSEYIYQVINHQFDGTNVQFVSTNLLGQFEDEHHLISAITVLPLLFFFSDYILAQESIRKLKRTFLIIFMSGIGLMAYHLHSLKEEVSDFPNILEIPNLVSSSRVQAGWYLGIGFILGTLITLIFFLLISKQKTPKSSNSHFSSDI